MKQNKIAKEREKKKQKKSQKISKQFVSKKEFISFVVYFIFYFFLKLLKNMFPGLENFRGKKKIKEFLTLKKNKKKTESIEKTFSR